MSVGDVDLATTLIDRQKLSYKHTREIEMISVSTIYKGIRIDLDKQSCVLIQN